MVLCVACFFLTSAQAQKIGDEKAFNSYILLAVEDLAKNRGALGYGSAAYTRDIKIGGAILKATKPPLTMCVAAQVEIIARALEIYSQEHPKDNFRTFLPDIQWKSLRPEALRGKIWMVKGASSNGTASALFSFGLGQEVPFEDLLPGAFLNLNRAKTGHAVVFLGYLDAKGDSVDRHGASVAGFKYFSSQGTESAGGFGYRYAFFGDNCPKLDEGRKRDCGVLFSRNQRILNTGYMLSPAFWDKSRRDNSIAIFNATKGLISEGQFDADFFDGRTTDD